MEVSRIRALRGPNLWSRHTAIEAIVSCAGAECSIGDMPGFEDRLRVHHKGALKILGLFSRVGVALFVRWAKMQPRVRDRTFPIWREWNSGHRWHMIHQVTEPPD